VETLQKALEPYRHLDMAGWVALYLYLPVWAALLCVVAGVLMLLWGGGKMFRLVAAPLGAAIGAVWVGGMVVKLGFAQAKQAATIVGTVGLFGLGLLFPPGVVFFAFGIPVGLVTGELAGSGDWLLGFAPGFVIGGAVGVVMHKIVGAVLSSAAGAWFLMMGLMAAVRPLTEAVQTLAANPVIVLALAGFLAIGGIVFQLVVAPTEEEAEEAKMQRAREKQRAKERKEVEARWSKFSKPRKDDGE
jgi:large-conductance mechanosensitive channel